MGQGVVDPRRDRAPCDADRHRGRTPVDRRGSDPWPQAADERRADAAQRGRRAEHAAAAQELDLAPPGGELLPQTIRHEAEPPGSDLSPRAPAPSSAAARRTEGILEEERVGSPTSPQGAETADVW